MAGPLEGVKVVELGLWVAAPSAAAMLCDWGAQVIKIEPGQLLVSDTVRGLARTSAGVAFDDRGEHELKGIEEPQRLFAVH